MHVYTDCLLFSSVSIFVICFLVFLVFLYTNSFYIYVRLQVLEVLISTLQHGKIKSAKASLDSLLR